VFLENVDCENFSFYLGLEFFKAILFVHICLIKLPEEDIYGDCKTSQVITFLCCSEINIVNVLSLVPTMFSFR